MQGLHSHNSYRLGECFFMKKLLLVVMSLVCMLLIAACAGQKEAGEESSRVLKVGLDANFPPFEYYRRARIILPGLMLNLCAAWLQTWVTAGLNL